MNLTYRQLILLTVATTLFYDEVAKTSTPEMKQEIMELSNAKCMKEFYTEVHYNFS